MRFMRDWFSLLDWLLLKCPTTTRKRNAIESNGLGKNGFQSIVVFLTAIGRSFCLNLLLVWNIKFSTFWRKERNILLSGIQSSQLECYVTPNNYYSFHRKKIDLNVTETTNTFSRILIQHLDNSTELPDNFGWLFSHPSRWAYSI